MQGTSTNSEICADTDYTFERESDPRDDDFDGESMTPLTDEFSTVTPPSLENRPHVPYMVISVFAN
jgi:hypothetical protein